MLADEIRDAVVSLVPHLVGRHRTKRHPRNFNAEIKLALMTDVDDDWVSTAAASKEVRDCFDRFLGCGKTNSHRRLRGEFLQALQRKRQVRATLVVSYCVDFIHDHGLNVAQNGAASLRSQQN